MGEGLPQWASGRQHLLLMDDEAVLLARQVAMAASAWRHAKADTEAYRRLVVAVTAWDAYVAPTLEPTATEDGVAAQIRKAARRALHGMDDEAAHLAGKVATTASAWLRAPTDAENYRRFAAATDDWDNYAAPRLEEPAEELLDQLADDSAPVSLSELLPEVTAQIHAADPRRR
ncbi:hypothetical protein JCM18899A_51970 [Nocardioides sp. AN3]